MEKRNRSILRTVIFDDEAEEFRAAYEKRLRKDAFERSIKSVEKDLADYAHAGSRFIWRDPITGEDFYRKPFNLWKDLPVIEVEFCIQTTTHGERVVLTGFAQKEQIKVRKDCL